MWEEGSKGHTSLTSVPTRVNTIANHPSLANSKKLTTNGPTQINMVGRWILLIVIFEKHLENKAILDQNSRSWTASHKQHIGESGGCPRTTRTSRTTSHTTNQKFNNNPTISRRKGKTNVQDNHKMKESDLAGSPRLMIPIDVPNSWFKGSQGHNFSRTTPMEAAGVNPRAS